MYRKQNQIMEIIICLIDGLITWISLLLGGLIRYRSLQALIYAENLKELFSVVFIIHVAAFYFLKVYEDFFQRGRYRELILSIKYNIILIAGSSLLGFGMKQEIFVSRLVMGYFLCINVVLIWIGHLLIRNRDKIFGKARRKTVNLLLVTEKERLQTVVESFSKSKETAWNIEGIVLLGEQEVPETWNGIPVVPGKEDEYLEFATQHVVDEVFIQVDAIQKQENLLKHMILDFEKMGIVVNLNLDIFNMGLSGVKRIYNLEQYHVVAFSSRLFDYRMVLLKRLMDIIGAMIGLLAAGIAGVILAPFLLLESPGPLIFTQKRVGVNGRTFDFYKFRSMYVDAEERKKELLDQNEMQGLMFKMENDPRITKVGAFIRKTSIDELPQFWNVLKGDMSLVGTRPPTLDEYQQYSYYQKRRISFRPGITGLWQISGRSDIKDFDEVVKLDLEYIDNWSLLLDVKIILKTIGVVFKGRGAR